MVQGQASWAPGAWTVRGAWAARARTGPEVHLQGCSPLGGLGWLLGVSMLWLPQVAW